MKALILAGGFGSRLSEETDLRPKPMVQIGTKPILWHIMKIYSHYGINDFVILLGYKGYYIKEYFKNYFLHHNDFEIDLRDNSLSLINNKIEPWKVTLIDTGLNTMTGGRIKRAEKIINGEPFLLTYGDGVANVNISKLIKFHKSHDKLLTLTSAQPDGRFGALDLVGDKVIKFSEKPKGDGSWVNAGFFVCENKVLDYIKDGDKTIIEQNPLKNMAIDGEIFTFKHPNFWMPMDTLRDKNILNNLWEQDKAPWKIWRDV